jgi:hypothetical protein
MKWPFSTMSVGDRVAIADNIPRAQAYVHVYARQSGKAFKTKTFTLADGSMVLGVRRIPDPPKQPQAGQEVRERALANWED